jgi:hypothetical protein
MLKTSDEHPQGVRRASTMGLSGPDTAHYNFNGRYQLNNSETTAILTESLDLAERKCSLSAGVVGKQWHSGRSSREITRYHRDGYPNGGPSVEVGCSVVHRRPLFR